MKSPLAALSALAAATLALTGCGATQSSSSSTASAASSQVASGKVEVFAAASLNLSLIHIWLTHSLHS